MRRFIFALLFLGMYHRAKAQQEEVLYAQGTVPGLYLVHVIQKGDNYYSLGRLYHLSPHEIAKANDRTFDSPLQLLQVIKIPLILHKNFSQTTAAPGADWQPVYHQVEEKETLYRISKHYGVSIEKIQAWNNLSGINIRMGDQVRVGWSWRNGEPNLLVKNEKKPGIPIRTTVSRPRRPQFPQAATGASAVKQIMPAPVVAVHLSPAPLAPPNDSNAKNTLARRNAFKERLSKLDNTNSAIWIARPEQQDTVRGSVDTGNRHLAIIPPPSLPAVPVDSQFEALYQEQTAYESKLKTEKGAATWFKSNIAPNSGKYYALHNTAGRGTIIKVINPLNGRFVYVKVLDIIPRLPQNEHIIIKISDAAQEALGVSEEKFFCELQYENQ